MFFICLYCHGQGGSRTYVENGEKKTLLSQSILPVSLIVSGILISDSVFEKNFQKEVRSTAGNNFSSSLDDYTRFAPIAQLYIADIAGLKAKNHWFDQTKNLILSSAITQLITTGLKRNIHKVRPNDFNAKAFPSGHTSHAFATAAVLYEEFNESSPFLAQSGYFFAGATGALRMMNNKHWLSDVLAGAGIGILVTKLVYHFDYLIAWNPFKKSKNTYFLPTYNENGVGLYFSKRF